ncbi:hypothetical protein G6F31_020169 [Rhizopus arrhizus]|nr:hypothetical protein G6F31_020169 [Rhizopus arrhizus]
MLTWPALPPAAACVLTSFAVDALPPMERAITPYTPSPWPVTDDPADDTNVMVDASPPRPALTCPPKSPLREPVPPLPPDEIRPTAALTPSGPGPRAVIDVLPCKVTYASPALPPWPALSAPPNPPTIPLSDPAPPQDWTATPKPVPMTVALFSVTPARCPSPPLP